MNIFNIVILFGLLVAPFADACLFNESHKAKDDDLEHIVRCHREIQTASLAKRFEEAGLDFDKRLAIRLRRLETNRVAAQAVRDRNKDILSEAKAQQKSTGKRSAEMADAQADEHAEVERLKRALQLQAEMVQGLLVRNSELLHTLDIQVQINQAQAALLQNPARSEVLPPEPELQNIGISDDDIEGSEDSDAQPLVAEFDWARAAADADFIEQAAAEPLFPSQDAFDPALWGLGSGFSHF